MTNSTPSSPEVTVPKATGLGVADEFDWFAEQADTPRSRTGRMIQIPFFTTLTSLTSSLVLYDVTSTGYH